MEFIFPAGQKIRSIRKRKKIRTADLAKICGVSESEMRHLENGTRIITEAQIEKAAEGLQVPPAALRARNIADYSDIMHILFEIHSDAQIEPVVTDDGVYLKINDPSLATSIQAWNEIIDKFRRNEITIHDRIEWEDHFPDSMPKHPEIEPFSLSLSDIGGIASASLEMKEISLAAMDDLLKDGIIKDTEDLNDET